MRSLVCQTLLYPNQIRPHLDWLTDDLVDDLESGNSYTCIGALCYLFEQLLQRVVGVSEIFCIVDGISNLERQQDGWCKHLDVVFDHLSTLRERLPHGLSFKLLLTSAEKSSQLAWQVSRSEHVSLRAGHVLSPDKSEQALAPDIQGQFAGFR